LSSVAILAVSRREPKAALAHNTHFKFA